MLRKKSQKQKRLIKTSKTLNQRKPHQKPQKQKSTYESSSKNKSLISAVEINHVNLYQAIALYRKNIASSTNQPIYRVFSNNAIKELCKQLPKTMDQLTEINGFV